MTSTNPAHEEPMSAEVFQRRLQELVQHADADGVPVAGGWTCRDEGEGSADWDVEIVEVASD
jgi:hypothetical protein